MGRVVEGAADPIGSNNRVLRAQVQPLAGRAGVEAVARAASAATPKATPTRASSRVPAVKAMGWIVWASGKSVAPDQLERDGADRGIGQAADQALDGAQRQAHGQGQPRRQPGGTQKPRWNSRGPIRSVELGSRLLR